MMRRALIVTGILALSALLAFPLRTVVYDVVVIPVAFILWLLGLIYHSLPQYLWWIVVILLVLYIFGKGVFQEVEFPKRRDLPPIRPQGNVEQLAGWITKSEKGVYNRWLVANRLGKLAFQILVLRESGKQRSVFEPLDGPDWNASPALTGYLHSGLQGSFADYPSQNNPFLPHVKTAIDHDVSEAVEFLESKIDSSIR
jgi:hypothetical protein